MFYLKKKKIGGKKLLAYILYILRIFPCYMHSVQFHILKFPMDTQKSNHEPSSDILTDRSS